MNSKHKFLLVLAGLAVLLSLWLSSATTSGDGFWAIVSAVVAAWFASPILFLALAYVLETSSTKYGRGRSFTAVAKSVFSFKTQAWSFIIGDIILLPLACALAADKWSHTIDRSGLSPLWWLVSMMSGVFMGLGFHYLMEKPGYTKLGHAGALDSPTKLFHDFVSYPVLFGSLLFAFGPLLFTPQWQPQLNFHTISIIILIGGWLYLGAKHDGDNAKKLIPWGHPDNFSWEEMGIVAPQRVS